jgi:hypothetical protein
MSNESPLTNEQHDLIAEWVFDMCEEYDLPFTNNEPRIQGGVQLRHVGEFGGDLLDLIKGIVEQQKTQWLGSMEAEWGVRYADFPDEISRRRGADVVRREMALCRKHGVDAASVRRDVTAWREEEPS